MKKDDVTTSTGNQTAVLDAAATVTDGAPVTDTSPDARGASIVADALADDGNHDSGSNSVGFDAGDDNANSAHVNWFKRHSRAITCASVVVVVVLIVAGIVSFRHNAAVKDARAAASASASVAADLQKSKQDALKRLDGMSDLTDDQRAQLKKQVNDAKDADSVSKAVASGQKIVDDALAAAKTSAADTVNGFANLDDAAKGSIKDSLSKATSSQDVNDILADAQAKQDAAQVAQEQADAAAAAAEQASNDNAASAYANAPAGSSGIPQVDSGPTVGRSEPTEGYAPVDSGSASDSSTPHGAVTVPPDPVPTSTDYASLYPDKARGCKDHTLGWGEPFTGNMTYDEYLAMMCDPYGFPH